MTCVLPVAGCSLAISGPDPERPRTEVPKCDTGKGAVGMDGLMTSILGVSSLASFANDESGAGLALGAFAGLFLASAIRGNNAANDCRAAFDDYNLAYRRMQPERFATSVGDEPAPRPVTIRKKPKPKPVAEPAATAPAPVEPSQEPATPSEPPAESISPEYASPRPPPRAAEPAKPAKPPRRADPDDEDWSVFWKEAP